MTDATVRPAADWDEVRQTAVGAGRAFPGRHPEAPFFRERTVRAPSLPLENTLVVVVDGDIVGGLQLYERMLYVGGHPVRTGAVGNVHTVPAHQGEGLGSQLVTAAAATLRDRGFAASILLTSAARCAFYAQAGWREVVFRTHEIETDGVGDAPDAVRFDAGDHLDDVADWYRATRRATTGSPRRSRPYWRSWVLDPGTEVLGADARIDVYPATGAPAGYVAWEPRDDGVHCLEVGYDPDRRDAAARTCWRFLAARAGGDPVVWHPPLARLPAAARDRVEAERPQRGTMVQAHDGDRLSVLAGDDVETTAAFRDLLSGGDFYWSALDAF
ncbi:MAG: GNAT family N-acetyltransferase [Halobacteriaceae archaeon]